MTARPNVITGRRYFERAWQLSESRCQSIEVITTISETYKSKGLPSRARKQVRNGT